MSDERYELAISASNKSLPLEQRIEAVFQLLDLDPELALHAALRVAEDPTENPETLRAVGGQLNVIGSAYRDPTNWELRDVCDIAHDAYCDPGSRPPTGTGVAADGGDRVPPVTALPDLAGLDGSQLVRLLSRPAPGLAGLTRGEWLAVAYLLASHLSKDQVDEWGAASAAVDYVLAAAETAGAMEHHETVIRRLNLSAAVLRRTPPRGDIPLLNPDGMAGLFAATVPMSAQRARSLAAGWRSLEVADICRLRLCKNLVKPLLLVSHLMTDRNAAELTQWEEILPLLP